jgi:hypothetical protein
VLQEEKPPWYLYSAAGGVKRSVVAYFEILGWRGKSSIPYNGVSGNDKQWSSREMLKYLYHFEWNFHSQMETIMPVWWH